jgi:hypothetical protein
MGDELCFVQFPHPGKEHQPDLGWGKSWNRNDHRRTFVKVPGRYLGAAGPQEGEIVFWAEWEPQARVVSAIADPLADDPRWVYEPYYVPPASSQGLQNTDPFVFGERFLYTGCKQHRKGVPTQLRYLASGSVILFGSCLRKSAFMLDTVFVVADHIDHSMRDYRDRLRNRVPEAYKTVVLEPWYADPENDLTSHRLYSGATYEASIEGMFSFVPCLPYEQQTRGFARPIISIPSVISDALCMGFKLNPQSSTSACKSLWNDVMHQVVTSGLKLGISARLPPRQTAPG